MCEAATSVNNIDELIAAVDQGFADPNAKSASRTHVAAEMFYKPGGATTRAVTEMYDVIELDQPATA
jgi:hypothetical protein